jgi:hypothetical protein
MKKFVCILIAMYGAALLSSENSKQTAPVYSVTVKGGHCKSNEEFYIISPTTQQLLEGKPEDLLICLAYVQFQAEMSKKFDIIGDEVIAAWYRQHPNQYDNHTLDDKKRYRKAADIALYKLIHEAVQKKINAGDDTLTAFGAFFNKMLKPEQVATTELSSIFLGNRT